MDNITTSRKRHIISLIIVFFAGILIGASLTLVGFRLSRPPGLAMFERRPEKRAELIARRMAEDYDLTQEQLQQVLKITLAHGKKVDLIIKRFEPELEDSFDSLHLEICEVLPEQKRAILIVTLRVGARICPLCMRKNIGCNCRG